MAPRPGPPPGTTPASRSDRSAAGCSGRQGERAHGGAHQPHFLPLASTRHAWLAWPPGILETCVTLARRTAAAAQSSSPLTLAHTQLSRWRRGLVCASLHGHALQAEHTRASAAGWALAGLLACVDAHLGVEAGLGAGRQHRGRDAVPASAHAQPHAHTVSESYQAQTEQRRRRLRTGLLRVHVGGRTQTKEERSGCPGAQACTTAAHR